MRIAFRNFTGGELSDTLSARYDLGRFQTSARHMENFLPNLHGDAVRRPGMRFIAELDGPSVLLPFTFNSEADQNFVLILSEGRLRVSDGTRLLDADVATPYRAEDLYAISHRQVGDVVYLAHKKYPLGKIIRSGSPGAYVWSYQTVVLNSSLAAPGAPAAAFVRGNADDTAELGFTLRYKVVAVDRKGMESLPSPAGEAVGKHPSDWVVGNHVDINWPAVEGAEQYNIYREEAGYYGFIGVAQAGNIAGGTISGLQAGTQVGNLVYFGGTIRREIVKSNGNPEADDSDVTSDLAVSPAPGQNAFALDGKLFVWCTKTTTTITWKRHHNKDGTWWTRSISTDTQRFWAMVAPVDPAQPAGNYQTYQTGDTGTSPDAPSGTIGVYTVRPFYSGGGIVSFVDNNYEADTSDTPKEDWNPFADGNHPATVAFHQQRLVLGGTASSPQSFYLSRTGDFENFRKSRPLMDDDPVEYVLASGSIDAVQWVESFGDLLVGTSGAEYKATGEGGVITAKSVNITSQSYWGSAGLAPIIVGNSVLHVQRHGAHVRDLFYSLEKDGYAGNDLSVMAPHLFEGHSLVQWAYQQSPGSRVWIVRDDGVLLCLTYMKEHDISGFTRHVTDGEVLSVASVSGDNEDAVFFVVRRAGRCFLERLAGEFGRNDPMAEAFFVDCGVTVRSEEAVEEIGGLEHLEGRELAALLDGSPAEGLTVRNGKIVLPYPARVIHAGLPYVSLLSPFPLEADTQNGSTLGRRRACGRCVIRLHRSVGGKHGASGDVNAMYDIPFLPESYGAACEPFSGDVEINPGMGQDAEASLWIAQDRPLPFQVVAIVCDVDFGEA